MVSLKKFHRPNFSEIQLYIFDFRSKLKPKTQIVELKRKELKSTSRTDPETSRHLSCRERPTLPTVCGRYTIFARSTHCARDQVSIQLYFQNANRL